MTAVIVLGHLLAVTMMCVGVSTHDSIAWAGIMLDVCVGLLIVVSTRRSG